MFSKYQITLFSENRIVECINFRGYDDFSAIHKAKRLFNSTYFDVVDLYKGNKKVKVFRK